MQFCVSTSLSSCLPTSSSGGVHHLQVSRNAVQPSFVAHYFNGKANAGNELLLSLTLHAMCFGTHGSAGLPTVTILVPHIPACMGTCAAHAYTCERLLHLQMADRLHCQMHLAYNTQRYDDTEQAMHLVET